MKFYFIVNEEGNGLCDNGTWRRVATIDAVMHLLKYKTISDTQEAIEKMRTEGNNDFLSFKKLRMVIAKEFK